MMTAVGSLMAMAILDGIDDFFERISFCYMLLQTD